MASAELANNEVGPPERFSMVAARGRRVRRSRSRVGAALLAPLLGLVACENPPWDSGNQLSEQAMIKAGAPEAAMKRQLRFVVKGEFGQAWDELHPDQQAIIPRDEFIRCGAARHKIEGIQVGDSRNVVARVPGTSTEAPSVAIEVALTSHPPGQYLVAHQTLHEFLVDGTWRWALNRAGGYTQGRCPEDW